MEPRTEAGRALLAHGYDYITGLRITAEDIIAIEDEAAASPVGLRLGFNVGRRHRRALERAFADYMRAADGAGSIQPPVVRGVVDAVADVLEHIPDEAAASPVLDVERLARAMAKVRPYGGNPSAWALQHAEAIAREYAALESEVEHGA